VHVVTNDALRLAWCDNGWCGQVYDVEEGWGGRCPSCLALTDEHLSGGHVIVIEACVECRREPRSAPRVTRRTA
jgi:hypothetical protein